MNLLQRNVPLKRALQACSGAHRWKQPRSVQVALGAMHTLILIYTPARLVLAAAGDYPLASLERLSHGLASAGLHTCFW